MAEIPLIQPIVPDIYSYGFDPSLNRNSILSTPVVYDSIEGAVEAKSIVFGGLIAGSQDTIYIVDPSKGMWMGDATFADAPFKVDMQGNLTANSATIAGVDVLQSSVFGDGSDGNVTISVNTTLTRDMFYENLTINSSITLTTAGYRIFVKTLLTNNGTISGNGASGGAGGAGGNGSGAGGGTAGTAGAVATTYSGSIFGGTSAIGVAGAVGGSGTSG